jgi:hypothetical protein
VESNSTEGNIFVTQMILCNKFSQLWYLKKLSSVS